VPTSTVTAAATAATAAATSIATTVSAAVPAPPVPAHPAPGDAAGTPPVRAFHAGPPATGPLARARLAGSAATAASWVRTVARSAEPAPAAVAAALDALGTLRTELRSLRPLLDREHAVRCRAATDAPARALAARHALDVRIGLLDGVAGDAEARVRRDALRRLRRRTPLILAGRDPAVGPGGPVGPVHLGFLDDLDDLVAGRIPLRDGAPLGDPGLPATVLLPPLLHRRFRKLTRDTDPRDAGAVHRRAAALRIVLALASDAGLDGAPGTPHRAGPAAVAAAAAALQDRAAAALLAATAAATAAELPPGPARDTLLATGAPALDGPLAELAALRDLLPVDTGGPARRAAGGVVLRPGPDGPEVLLVHRTRRGDWSLPKGAVEPGESDVGAALREVREETGLRCRAGAEVTGVRYRDRNRRAKQVRYWLMTPLAGGTGRPDPAEIGDVAWVPLRHAAGRLTRERDRVVVSGVAAEHAPPNTRRRAR
jgi:8-oxo-dGTP pyrophosphatase MutT (NUDIX family)